MKYFIVLMTIILIIPFINCENQNPADESYYGEIQIQIKNLNRDFSNIQYRNFSISYEYAFITLRNPEFVNDSLREVNLDAIWVVDLLRTEPTFLGLIHKVEKGNWNYKAYISIIQADSGLIIYDPDGALEIMREKKYSFLFGGKIFKNDNITNWEIRGKTNTKIEIQKISEMEVKKYRTTIAEFHFNFKNIFNCLDSSEFDLEKLKRDNDNKIIISDEMNSEYIKCFITQVTKSENWAINDTFYIK